MENAWLNGGLSAPSPRAQPRWTRNYSASTWKFSSTEGSPKSVQSKAIPPTVSGTGSIYYRVGSRTKKLDLDDDLSIARAKVIEILLDSRFEAAIGLVIMANSVTIGMEITNKLQDKPDPVVAILEHVFLCIYIAELGLRWFAMRSDIFVDVWVQFDILVVVVGSAMTWILEPYFSGLKGFDQTTAQGVGIVVVLRTGRLFRLARAVRLMRKFKDLWLLVRGLLSCGRTMLYTYALTIILCYIFACIGVEVSSARVQAARAHGEANLHFEEIISEFFGSVPAAMLTMVQFVCMDSIHDIYRTLIQEDWVFSIYFMLLIMVVGIVLMNLVTAVIVNGALEQASADRDVKIAQEKHAKQQRIGELALLFTELDKDRSGTMSLSELTSVEDHEREKLEELMPWGLAPEELFNALDPNGLGEISIEDFCNGLYDMSVSETPFYIQKQDKAISLLAANVGDLQDMQFKMMEMLKDFGSQMQHIIKLPEGPAPVGCTADVNGRQLMQAVGNTFAFQPETSRVTPAWLKELTQDLVRAVEKTALAAPMGPDYPIEAKLAEGGLITSVSLCSGRDTSPLGTGGAEHNLNRLEGSQTRGRISEPVMAAKWGNVNGQGQQGVPVDTVHPVVTGDTALSV